MWDLKEGRVSNPAGSPRTLTIPGTTGIINTLAFGPDGTKLAAGFNNGSVQIWSLASGKLITELVEGSEVVWTLAFSPDGAILVSGGNDGQLRQWDMLDFQFKPIPSKITFPIADLAFHASGKFLACARFDGPIQVWPLEGTVPEPLLLEGHAGAVASVAFQPGTNTVSLLSGGRDGTVRLWDVVRQKELTQFGHGQFVNAVAFTAGGKVALSAGDGGLLKLWDIDSGHLLATYRDFLPYEGVNISRVSGLSPLRQMNLVGLGAIDQP